MATYQLTGKYYHTVHCAEPTGHWYRLFYEFDAPDDAEAWRTACLHLAQAYPSTQTKELELVRPYIVPPP